MTTPIETGEWLPGEWLLGEKAGTLFRAEVTWKDRYVRAMLIDSATILRGNWGEPLNPPGNPRVVIQARDSYPRIHRVASVVRFSYLESLWVPGELVLKKGVPREDWRAVISDEARDGKVQVERLISGNWVIQWVADERLESAERPGRKLHLKRGPIHSDRAIEALNSAAIRAQECQK